MKTTRLMTASLVMLFSALAVSCNKTPERSVVSIDFDSDAMAGEIGRPFSEFVEKNADYIFATNMADGVVVLNGLGDIDGQQVDLNIFVTSDYEGNVAKILAQPVDYGTYGRKLWDYYTAGAGMSGLGSFVCGKFRTSEEVGVVGSISELDEMIGVDGSDGLFVCVVFEYVPDKTVMVPIYEDRASALLISASHVTVHYDTAGEILYSDYETVRNENFILSTVVSEEKLKSTTLDDASDVLGNRVDFTVFADVESTRVRNINVTPLDAGSPEAMQSFWKSYVENADGDLKLGKFESAALVTDGEDTEDVEFEKAELAVDYLEQNGMPSPGQTLTVGFVTNDIHYSICLDSESAYLDIRNSAYVKQ